MLAKLVLLCAVTSALGGLKWQGSVNQTESKKNPVPDSSLRGAVENASLELPDVGSKKLPTVSMGPGYIRYHFHDFKLQYVFSQEHDPNIQSPGLCWNKAVQLGYNAMSYSTQHNGCYFKHVVTPFPGLSALDPWNEGFCQVKF